MKKNIFYLFVGVSLLGASVLMSCKKSNEALINDYEEVCVEMVEAVKDGDIDKVPKLTEKAEKIATELSKRDLTLEEKTKVLKITAEMATDVAASGREMYDSAKESFGF